MRPISSLFIESFRIFKEHVLVFLLIQLIIILIRIVTLFLIGTDEHLSTLNIQKPQGVPVFPLGEAKLVGFILSLVSITTDAWAFGAIISFFINKKLKIMDIFKKGFVFFIPLFAAGLFNSLALMVGFSLFVIPGIILSVLFWFYPYFIVEERTSVVESFKKSFKLAKANFVSTLFRLLSIAVVGFVLGMLAFLSKAPFSNWFAVLLTVPFFTIFGYLVFQDLKKKA